MRKGRAGSRHVGTAFAAGLLIAALSMPIVGWRAACDAPDLDLRATAPGLAPVKWRGAGLQSLGRCDACHAAGGVPGIGQLALTPSAAVRDLESSAPADDAARVQAGGEVYNQACASCHAAGDDPSRAAPVVGLSEGQIAALAAFLQRHTVTAPPWRERPRAML